MEKKKILTQCRTRKKKTLYNTHTQDNFFSSSTRKMKWKQFSPGEQDQKLYLLSSSCCCCWLWLQKGAKKLLPELATKMQQARKCTKALFSSGWCTKNIICVLSDGKFHVIPSSGDLHIHRADFSDTLQPFSCRVRNAITGREEESQPYNLIISGRCLLSSSILSVWCCIVVVH